MSCTVDPLVYFDYAVVQHQVLSKLASGVPFSLGEAGYCLRHWFCFADFLRVCLEPFLLQ